MSLHSYMVTTVVDGIGQGSLRSAILYANTVSVL